MLLNVLRGSILGTVYGWCQHSVFFAILRRIYHFLRRAFGGSRVFGAAFGETKLDNIYIKSIFAKILRLPWALALRLCQGFAGAARGSKVCRFLAPAMRSSRILDYETLFGGFFCIMFIFPHGSWNNLYGVIAAVIFLVIYLFLCAAGKRRFVYPEALGLGFTLFLIACVISLLFTGDIGDSFRVLLFFLASFIFCYLIAVSFDNPKSLRRLMGFLYVSVLAVCMMGILQRVFHLVSVNSSYTDTRYNVGVPGRVYGPLDNPNNLSGFIQVFLPLCAAYAGGTKPGRKRTLLGLGLLIPFVAMIMTYARAGWIAIVLAAAVFMWYVNKRALPFLLLLGLAILPLMPQSVLTRLASITNSDDSSANHRFAIWAGVIDLLKDHWLTGIGIGPNTFHYMYQNYAHWGALDGAYHSQMLYLELDMEMGILGFLSFLWMMLKYAGRLGRAVGRTREPSLRFILIACVSTLAALAFSAIFEYLWFYPRCTFAFFAFFGIAIAALRMAGQEAVPAHE